MVSTRLIRAVWNKFLVAIFLGSMAGLLSACGNDGETPTYTIGGTVSDLEKGQSLVLQNNGDESLTVATNGSFSFANKHANSATYNVTIAAQPKGQTCAINNGAGNVSGEVTGISVTCSTPLDTSFGIGGKVTTQLAVSYDVAFAAAVQPDGKILAAGVITSAGFGLVRYNADGTLDLTFGTNGIVATDFVGSGHALAIAIQPSDNRIVVAGSASGDFALARYNTDGTLDTSFGTGGKVITAVSANYDEIAGIAIQPSDNRIVVVGHTVNAITLSYDFALARYNPNGTLDTSFGTGGIVTTDIKANDSARGVVVQPTDNKIVLAGHIGDAFVQVFALARYNTDGTLDTSFGTGGIVTTDIGIDDSAQGIVIQPADNRIVVAGYAFNAAGYSYDFALARYNPNGTLDTSFGTGGIVTTDLGKTSDFANALAIQSDGKIVVAGYSANPTGADGYKGDFALARYNTYGTLDETFATDGKVITDFGADSAAYAVAIRPDGKIVAAGRVRVTGLNYDFALAGYLP